MSYPIQLLLHNTLLRGVKYTFCLPFNITAYKVAKKKNVCELTILSQRIRLIMFSLDEEIRMIRKSLSAAVSFAGGGKRNVQCKPQTCALERLKDKHFGQPIKAYWSVNMKPDLDITVQVLPKRM